MAGMTGLEPATSGVTGQRSNQLSYIPIKKTYNLFKGQIFLNQVTKKNIISLLFNGGRWEARTPDPLDVNQMLYQLS